MTNAKINIVAGADTVTANAETLTCLPNIRWKEKPSRTKVLQQAWQSSSGAIVWKNVPTVD